MSYEKQRKPELYLWHFSALQTGAGSNFSSSLILKIGMTEAYKTLKGSLASRVFCLWVLEVICSLSSLSMYSVPKEQRIQDHELGLGNWQWGVESGAPGGGVPREWAE